MITLIDSSVWISHFRAPEPALIRLLERKEALTHSSILGEIAAGGIRNRTRVLGDLKLIPRATEIDPDDILDFIEFRGLHGKALSWVDLQLLASSLATPCHLLTFEKRLGKIYEQLAG